MTDWSDMGVLPLEYAAGSSRDSLGLTGEETFEITGLAGVDRLPREIAVKATTPGGETTTFTATVRIDTAGEAEYYRHGGILQYVLRSLL